MAIAWATVVFLVLLLPGIAFFVGIVSSFRFSRAAIPQSAMAQLAGVVFISFSVHTILVLAVEWLSRWQVPTVDFHVLLSALQAGESGAVPVDRMAENLEDRWGWIALYLCVALVLSVVAGHILGKQAVARRWRLFVPHGWLYEVYTGQGSRSDAGDLVFPVVEAFVLTKLGHADKHLRYEGFLEEFGSRVDGAFSYLLLKQPRKSVFDLASLTSDPTEISGRALVDAKASKKPPFLQLAGDEIRNVVFQKRAEIDASNKEHQQKLKTALEQRTSPRAAPASGSSPTTPT